MIDVLCGVVLVGIGYLLGTKRKPKAEAVELTEDEKRAEKKAKEQLEQLLNFNGKAGG